ncbi:YjfB family protein [Tindallia californiensis]|uniref:Putative motility protein n=1 Tax=Tindallia californiensis TaxID=159292 RepID=A0A1H3L9X6_9FIRM|nr:YjfB family protein [Tindallia californiensis]SDY61243.1 Putative motility protein [Tindallia californiensis]
MDVAAMSIALNQMKLQQEASVSVLKMAMDGGSSQMEGLEKMLDANTKMLEQSVTPHLGGNLDIQL